VAAAVEGAGATRTADYCAVPRKNGKSTLSAGIALYLLVADGEQGAEVHSATTARDQARIVFDEAKRMVSSSPALKRRVQVLTWRQSRHPLDGRQRPVAQDPAGNLKPAQDKSTERIDGMSPLVMAIGRALVAQEQPQPSYQVLWV
jgi:phage terminase large subunit-like protein